MKIYKIGFLFDGGTIGIFTDKGRFYVDRRLFTETNNSFYRNYPNEKNSRLVNEEEKQELLLALTQYSLDMYYNYLFNKPFDDSIEKYYDENLLDKDDESN